MVIAFFLNKGAERIARSNEEGKIVQSLIEDLTKKDDNTHSDVALLSLEKFLRQKNNNELTDIDKVYIVEVAKTLLQPRLSKDSAFNSSIPFTLWQKYDSQGVKSFMNDYAENNKTVLDTQGISTTNLESSAPVAQGRSEVETNIISSLKKKIVYIQYADETQKNIAKQIQDTLAKNGWIAPGIEHIPGKYRDVVKFFNVEDKELAGHVIDLIKDRLHLNFSTVSIPASSSKKYNVPKGQIEIWVGADH